MYVAEQLEMLAYDVGEGEAVEPLVTPLLDNLVPEFEHPQWGGSNVLRVADLSSADLL